MQKKDEKRIFSSPGTSPCRDHKFAATTLQVNLAPRFKAFSWPVHPSWRQAKPPQNLIPFCTFPEIHQKKVVGVMVFSNCKVSCSTHKLLKGQLRYVYIYKYFLVDEPMNRSSISWAMVFYHLTRCRILPKKNILFVNACIASMITKPDPCILFTV